MFTERLHMLPGRFAEFSPAPPITDRQAWTNLPADIIDQLVSKGFEALDGQSPALMATDYMQFVTMGDRARFEAKYFARRRRLNALVLAECVMDDGVFLDEIANGIWLLCEETGWQLPAHNSQVRNGTRQALPDPQKPVVDLFAAETGGQLALIAHLLADRLNSSHPGLIARIDQELETRIFSPYLSRHYWWMGNGDEPMNNWTAWCTQNILLATFCRLLPPARQEVIVRRAAASLDAFIKDYGDDGACEEGPLYYRHAALCLWGALEILATAAPAAFSDLWRHPKIRNMAEYLPLMHVAHDYYLNFADSSAVMGPAGARELLFGQAVDAPALIDYASTDAAKSTRIGDPDEVNLWYRTLDIFTASTLRERPVSFQPRPDRFFPSIGLLVARDEEWVLGVKAGNNGDGHNHNDVGSLILYRHGQPFLIDIGVETYTAKTFSAQRYDIWTMQSAWHNLPTFEGVMQHEGAEFGARDLEVQLEADAARVSFDIAPAYPRSAGLRSYRRTVDFVKKSGVRICDVHDGDKQAELSLLFAFEPKIRSTGLELAGLGRIEIDGCGPVAIEHVAIHDPRLQTAWPSSIWRARLPFKGRTLSLWIN